MRKNAVLLFFVVIFLLMELSGSAAAEDELPLWPEIEPYEEGYLQVSDLHRIHYRLCGHPEGIPVFVIHGGPGAGCYPFYRRFFDPEKYLIVLHDQRGCGRSEPHLETKENTTWTLVDDIEELRKYLDVEKIILFGGSWGTTLGLAYAEEYPERTLALVLRGIFLATDFEMQHYYYGGVRSFFPGAYEKLKRVVAGEGRELSPGSLLDLITGEDVEKRKKFSIAWIEYEGSISNLVPRTNDLETLWDENELWRGFMESMALLENYYMANDCFLEDGQLIENAGRLEGIPTYIVNGRYDTVCPPVSAYLLHKAIPGSKLMIIEKAGHSMSEPPTEKVLLEIMVELEEVFTAQ
ncbi:MAG: prolyl aminopeptidase [Candidatus Krumholzibacteria bacterium]|nr:prolyl aminopeptidase [Candidatus Krumholzibacteria bacterium]